MIKRIGWIFALTSAVAFGAPTLNGSDLVSGKAVEVKPSDKGLVIAFLSYRCPCSNSHVPELIELAKANPDFNFVGVHSNMDEDLEPSKAYFQGMKMPFPVIQDDGAKIADEYKALKTPHVFVVDANGEKLFQGGMSDSKDCATSGKKYLRDALRDLKAGQKVKVATVRTLGCAISRRPRAH